MGGGETQSAFALSWLSLPHAVLVVSLAISALVIALTRGNELIRSSLLLLNVAVLPYSVCQTLIGSCTDAAVAEPLARLWVASVSLVGPALMLSLLAASGRFERHRLLLAVAFGIAVVSCVITLTTDLVIKGVWQTPWGLFFPRAGPLNDLHVGQVLLWSGVGFYLSRRGRQLETARQRAQTRRVAVVLALASLGITDALLAHGYGVFPFGVVPACAGVWVVTIGATHHDLLHSRGFDWAGAFEIAVIAGLGVLLVGAVWLLSSVAGISDPLLLAVCVAPLLALAHAGLMAIRARARSEASAVASDADRALEEFVAQASRARKEGELATQLAALLGSHAGLQRARLFSADDDGKLTPVEPVSEEGAEDEAASAPTAVDARVRPWMIANRAPLVADELSTMRLGGLRDPVEAFMLRLRAEVVLPLVDRGRLVGVIAADAPFGGRALRDSERETFQHAGKAAGQALTYLRLLHEAEARVEVAKEVEVAAAVQHARAAGEQRLHFSGCEIIGYYQPAAQFGGHWWSAHELPDGRVLVVLADVCGQGVSAALVSFTAEGACETAQRMLGASADVMSVLHILNESVAGVGGSEYAMSCFAALFDVEAGTVTYANAGHPFPYVCRQPDEGQRIDRAQLRALVSRGTPLGSDELILSAAHMKLEPDDMVVFFSDSVVDLLSPEGVPYGDRRLQRVLRTRVRGADERACRVILDDALSHYGNREMDDDINLIVVRLQPQ